MALVLPAGVTTPTPTRRTPRRTLVASGAAIKLDDQAELARYRRRSALSFWQERAWIYNDEVPELSFGHNFVRNTMSRVRLVPAIESDDPEAPPVPLDDQTTPDGLDPDICTQILDRLQPWPALMGGTAFGLDIAGEVHVALIPDDDEIGGERCRVLSNDELLVKDGWYIREDPSDQTGRRLPDGTELFRLWNPHGRWSSLPTSPMRALIEIADTLMLSTQMLRGMMRSRVAMNAGFLWISHDVSLESAAPDDGSPTEDAGDGAERDDPFIEDFMDAATAAMIDHDSAAAVLPIILRGSGKPDELIKHIDIARPLDETWIKIRDELLQRIANGVDLPREVILGLGINSNHWCLSDDTEILTRAGWRTHDDLQPGDVVLTLNHDTGESEWQAVEDVARFDVDNLPMLSMESRSHSSLSTAQHRWPIIKTAQKIAGSPRQWTTSEGGFARHDKVQIAAHCAELPTEAKYADDFVRLVAVYTSDGTLMSGGTHRGRPKIHITKFSAFEIDAVRAILTRLYGPARVGCWTETIHKATPRCPRSGIRFHLSADVAAPLLDVTGDVKAITQEFALALTEAQAGLLLDAMIEIGDGNRRENSLMFFQSEPARLEALELLAILLGRSVARNIRPIQEASFNTRPLHILTIGNRKTITPRSARQEWQPYTGIVWCPVTANKTWLARRHGTVYYTGNTAETIKENTWHDHLEPRALSIVSGITQAYYRPQLLAAKVDPQIARRCTVWYDPSWFLGSPDLSESADQGLADYNISGETWRRVKGYSEDDAMTPEEVEWRVSIKQRENVRIREVGTAPVDAVEPDTQTTTDTPAPKQTDPQVDIPDTPNKNGKTAQVASGGPAALDRLGGRIVNIERDLRTRLLQLADAAMGRALERAGMKVLGKLRGRARISDEQMRALAALAEANPGDGDRRRKLSEAVRTQTMIVQSEGHVPGEVASVLGRAAVLSLGLEDEALLAGALGDLEQRYHFHVRRAQHAAARAAASASGGDIDLDALDQQTEDHRAAGWVLFSTGLLALAHGLLYDPHPDAPPVGEFDESTLVPPGLVRNALDVAGGSNGPDAPPSGDARPAGGGATGGPSMLDEFKAQLGIVDDTYTWVYGDAPRVAFPPHLDLDGVTFSSFEDDVLANGDSFPDGPYFFPGDHQNCACDVEASFRQEGESMVATAVPKGGARTTRTPDLLDAAMSVAVLLNGSRMA